MLSFCFRIAFRSGMIGCGFSRSQGSTGAMFELYRERSAMGATEREDSWNTDPTTLKILRQVASLGYLVSVFRLPSSLWGTVPACVEMHAVNPKADPADKHVAKVPAGEAD